MKRWYLIALIIPSMGLGAYDGAEVKVSYPCEVLNSLNKDKEENVRISFYDSHKNALNQKGLSLRKRVSESGVDFTVKKRSETGFALDENLFKKLKGESAHKLKCELDIIYSPQRGRVFKSCSLRTQSGSLSKNHFDFFKMTYDESVLPVEVQKNLKEFTADATSWKMKLTGADKKRNPFTKRPDIEKWVTRGECRLEISGKFETQGASESEIMKKAEDGFHFILSLVKSAPSKVQGNKTSWVLNLP